MNKFNDAFNRFLYRLYKLNYFVSMLIWILLLPIIIIPMGYLLGYTSTPYDLNGINIKFDIFLMLFFGALLNSVMRLAVAQDKYNKEIVNLIDRARAAKTEAELIEIQKISDKCEINTVNTQKLNTIIETRLGYEFKAKHIS